MILTTSYFPNNLYIRRLISSDSDVTIEACENYQKQSLRNRFLIAGDKGTQTLTMPVHSYNNIPVRDVTVDYSMPWQREHLRAVKTCYGSAPYFPYVMDKIEDLFSLQEKYLLDYNLKILQKLMEILNIQKKIKFTEKYEPLHQDDDRLIAARNFRDPDPRPYYQVFSEKQDFIPNLSIIDYMMCEGPEFRG